MNRATVSFPPANAPALRPRAVFTAVVALLLLASSSNARAAVVERASPPALAAPQPFALPLPARFTLKNGLRVLFVERHRAPLIDMIAVVGSGGLDDRTGHEGEAAALGDMLTEGAGTRDAFAFDDAVKSLGAAVGGDVTTTATQLRLHVMSARFTEGLALFADALLRPRLDDDDWSRKRAERIAWLASLRDDPRTLAALAAARALYPTGRQGLPLHGTGVSVAATSAADLRALHAARFRPDNTFLVVVGDIDRATLTARLEAALGPWARPAEPLVRHAPAEPAPLADRSVVVVDRPGAPQTALQIVAPLPASLAAFDPDAAVLQTMLGGSFTSRLNDNLREQHGYAYGAGYGISTWPAHRSTLSTNVATPVTLPALDEIFRELARIHERAPDEEVARARAYEALSFPEVLDGGAALASAWATWEEQRIPDDVVAGYVARTLAVDAPRVERAAARLVDADHVAVVVVGDAASIGEGLSRFGAVRRLTAEELLPDAPTTEAPKTEAATTTKPD